MTYKLTDTAMMCRLTRRQWGAKKNDKDVARKVEEITGAEKNSGKYDKTLGKSATLNAIRSNYNEIYMVHNRLTSPWMEGAWRIIANVNIEQHREETTEIMDEIDAWVIKFGDEYDMFVQRAEKRLGSMYNSNDYPSRAVVVDKFVIERAYARLPVTDFRIKGLEDFESDLVAEAVASEKRQVETLLDDLWQRIYTPLQQVHKMLIDPDARVYSSVIDKVRGMADILPSLNITNDPDLTQMAKTLKMVFGNVDAEDVKLDPVFRKAAADKTDKMLNDIAGFGFAPPSTTPGQNTTNPNVAALKAA